MLPFFWYVIKVIICSGILFGYYWLFLRNKIFHQYNRFYLLAALTLSLLLPLMKIDFWQQADSQQSQVLRALQVVSAGDEYMNNIIITANKNDYSLQQLYPVVYWMVSVVFLLIMLQAVFVIRSLLKKYPVQLIDKVSFVNTEDKSTPFSFFKYIFWNANIDMDTTTGKQIFKHEVAHIQEKHTYDKLLINIILIFFWCNPFFWLYRKELNMIHEFIADKKAVEDSDTATFAAMILQAAYPQHRFQLTNNFFYSPIKRRLLMLTKNSNPRVNYFGRIMVLPLAALVFAAFSIKAKSVDDKDIIPSNIPASLVSYPAPLHDTIPFNIFINSRHADATYLKSNEFKNKALIVVDSKEIGNFGNNYIEKDLSVYSSLVVYGPAEAKKIYGEKGRYGAIKLTQKDAVFIKGDSFTYDERSGLIKVSGTNTSINGNMSSTLICVDGKTVSPAELNAIEPAKISSISILKGENLDGITETEGKTAIINVSLKPADLAEVVVVGKIAEKEYPVAIALEKMNVLYIGVDNPVTIAVPDIPNDKLLVMIDNGSITGSNGKYNVRVTQVGDATIKVATIKDNKKVLLSSQVYRVKSIPDPVNGSIPVDLDLKLRYDSNKMVLNEREYVELYSKLKLDDSQKQLQLAATNDLIAKTVMGQKLKTQEMHQLKQNLVLQEENKVILDKAQKELKLRATNDLIAKTVEGQKLKTTEMLQLKQNLILQEQIKSKLNDAQKELLLKSSDDALKKVVLDQKELLLQRSDLVFTKAEIEPQFTGGDVEWRKYLEKNLNPTLPVNEGWKAGKYTLIVKFIVHADGTISNVQVENYKGTKTAQHCIDIIKNGPKWLPAIQNGKKVNAFKKQPITFVIEEN